MHIHFEVCSENRIPAIKAMRAANPGMGLKDAKEIVDSGVFEGEGATLALLSNIFKPLTTRFSYALPTDPLPADGLLRLKAVRDRLVSRVLGRALDRLASAAEAMEARWMKGQTR